MDNKDWGTGEPGRPYTMGEIQEAARAQMQEKTCGGTTQTSPSVVPRVVLTYRPQPIRLMQNVVLTLTEAEARKLLSVLGGRSTVELDLLYSGLYLDLHKLMYK